MAAATADTILSFIKIFAPGCGFQSMSRKISNQMKS